MYPSWFGPMACDFGSVYESTQALSSRRRRRWYDARQGKKIHP